MQRQKEAERKSYEHQERILTKSEQREFHELARRRAAEEAVLAEREKRIAEEKAARDALRDAELAQADEQVRLAHAA